MKKLFLGWTVFVPPACEDCGMIKLRDYLPGLRDDGQVIAVFGQARLLKYYTGKLELRGGSREDRQAAKEWISLFMHEAVVKEV